MTPTDISVLLYYHCFPTLHPRADDPDIAEVTGRFLRDGILDAFDGGYSDGGYYLTTGRGKALAEKILRVPYPELTSTTTDIETAMTKYYLDTGREATSIYLGHNQMRDLVQWLQRNSPGFADDIERKQRPEFNGRKLFIVNAMDHLAVA